MICILKMNGAEIAGWIIATDMDDARRLAHGAGQIELAEALYRMTAAPRRGKHELLAGYTMLVS